MKGHLIVKDIIQVYVLFVRTIRKNTLKYTSRGKQQRFMDCIRIVQIVLHGDVFDQIKQGLVSLGYEYYSSNVLVKFFSRKELMYELVRILELLEYNSMDRIFGGDKKPKEESFDWDADMTRRYSFPISDDLRVAGMQKMHALKQNGLLQEELNWQDINFISNSLYTSGYLKHHELDQIQDKSQPRRKAVNYLVDSIIENPLAVLAFMRILESENRFSYIAARIRSAKIAAAALEKQETVNETSKKQNEEFFVVLINEPIWSEVGKHLDLEFKEVLKGPFQNKESSQKQ